MAENINRVLITGNLTRDPEYKEPREGVQVCNLRVAVNEREKQGDSWGERANFFDVTVFGGQARNVNEYLSKGSAVAIDGRLRWREWTPEGSDTKRQAVSIIASAVQFLDTKHRDGGSPASSTSDVPPDTSDMAAAPASAADDDDIPF